MQLATTMPTRLTNNRLFHLGMLLAQVSDSCDHDTVSDAPISEDSLLLAAVASLRATYTCTHGWMAIPICAHIPRGRKSVATIDSTACMFCT